MQQSPQSFLETLWMYLQEQNNRVTASGDPDATQDHLIMLTLYRKISDIDAEQDWYAYQQAVLEIARKYRDHIKENKRKGWWVVNSAVSTIEYWFNHA